MEKLEKNEGKYYTQNIDNLPIEERIFFTQGLVANLNDFRIATESEVAEWEEYNSKMLNDYEQS